MNKIIMRIYKVGSYNCLPDRNNVCPLPQDAETMTWSFRVSTLVGISLRMLSQCPSWPLSFLPKSKQSIKCCAIFVKN